MDALWYLLKDDQLETIRQMWIVGWANRPITNCFVLHHGQPRHSRGDCRPATGGWARELKRSFLTLPSPERQTGFYVMSASSLNTHNLYMDCLPRYESMHSIIYLVGLVVVVLFILSALGLR
jgi:hypothetical protein